MNLRKITEEYTEKSTVVDNLTDNEKEGMRSLKEKVKKAEIVIQQTDKSGRNCVDSLDNYKLSVQPHISNDIPINEEEHQELEKTMNAHSYTWTKILNMGKYKNSHERIRNSLKTKNSEYATLSCLRKDHKEGFDTDEGPPGHPLCSGNVSFNYRFSHLLCILLQNVPEDRRPDCKN